MIRFLHFAQFFFPPRKRLRIPCFDHVPRLHQNCHRLLLLTVWVRHLKKHATIMTRQKNYSHSTCKIVIGYPLFTLCSSGGHWVGSKVERRYSHLSAICIFLINLPLSFLFSYFFSFCEKKRKDKTLIYEFVRWSVDGCFKNFALRIYVEIKLIESIQWKILCESHLFALTFAILHIPLSRNVITQI